MNKDVYIGCKSQLGFIKVHVRPTYTYIRPTYMTWVLTHHQINTLIVLSGTPRVLLQGLKCIIPKIKGP